MQMLLDGGDPFTDSGTSTPVKTTTTVDGGGGSTGGSVIKTATVTGAKPSWHAIAVIALVLFAVWRNK